MWRPLTYPMRGNVFVPPSELELPKSHLNPNNSRHYNNHHLAFTAKRMGRLALTQTFRDLDRNQVILPLDTHNELHDTYDPPRLPDLRDIFGAVDDAYQNNEFLRYGSARHPIYRSISPMLIQALCIEYNEAAA